MNRLNCANECLRKAWRGLAPCAWIYPKDACNFMIMQGNFEQLPLKDFTEKAYLDYSMYVILDRALPNIADGLNRVQRRIVYAMSELGLTSAPNLRNRPEPSVTCWVNIIRTAIPACYEAMVLMAQDFSYRYPLVDDRATGGRRTIPKSCAAMRYTESRLTAYAQTLLSELGAGHRVDGRTISTPP